MGSSTSKAASGARSAARHFPSANAIQERAANAAATAAAKSSNVSRVTATSSPRQDYLKEQRRLEEELARYDRLSGESRPFEDTPSAAELQFFGNLRTIGQVEVPNPDQIKHQEAEEILKRKEPTKPISSKNTPSFAPTLSTSTVSVAASAFPTRSENLGPTLTSLKLMELFQLRNQDPSVWTVEELSKEFDMKTEDIQALTKYINTYTILPGKDAKGRETGVWCEDLRGVEIQDKPSAVKEAEEAKVAHMGSASSSSPSTTKTTIVTAATSPTAAKTNAIKPR
ncbi:hypothetical protein BGZ65_004582 [Modicella reniformis]|uniref:NADH dehydrogenase [ubiquinone] 1 alpha subcomplex assembly factor 4 n=1 Tax=Modicella reniformis TaxID=1440133 RepID=A0A9P6MKX3_9FUNG|nr:hypothetical protein BGZ65_004582 [Modicella reniformis]